MNRDTILKDAIKLLDKYNNIILQWGTSLGKSRGAIKMANYLMKRDKKSFNILLVVAERAHKSNWQAEIDKWKLHQCNLRIECYASLKKYRNTSCDLIIFDEAHHLKSDVRLDILKSMSSTYKIFLSATLSNRFKSDLKYIVGDYATSSVSIDDAIKNDILPEPKIYLVPLELDNTKREWVVEEGRGLKAKRRIIECALADRNKYLFNKVQYPNITLRMKCTALEAYNYYTLEFNRLRDRYMNTRNEAIKFKWLQAGNKRKILLGESKDSIVKTLLDKLQDKRYICFCTNIKQALKLGGKHAVHSKNNKSFDVLESFNNKEINHLFAIKMLQEGQNLVDIQAGIIIQLDGEERTFVQRFGRSMRAEDPVQFIFYYKGTRDEEYLENALQDIDKQYITVIEDLNSFSL